MELINTNSKKRKANSGDTYRLQKKLTKKLNWKKYNVTKNNLD